MGARGAKQTIVVGQSKCRGCTHLLRPSRTTAAQYPGTVLHQGRQLCGNCAARIKRNAEVDQARTKALAREITAYLRSRGRQDPGLTA